MTLSNTTKFGILIALTGLPLVIQGFHMINPEGPLSSSFVAGKELTLLGLTGLFLIFILKIEKRGLDSIGLHGKHWGKSVLWALGLTVFCFAVLMGLLWIFKQVGISFGEGAEAQRYENVSVWAILLMVIRAGVAEEIFYRGYLMERLHDRFKHPLVYLWAPAIIFGLWHFRQGPGGIIISTVMGLILAFVYWKKRDLKSNIIAHFLVDFIPNILAA